MRRRTFFKVVGASAAALAAGAAVQGCSGSQASSLLARSVEGATVSGQPDVAFSTTVDVLVLGSGVAGLSAAMDPSEAGYSVMVAEKLDVLGGESYESNAVLHVVGSSVQQQAGITLTCDEAWPERRQELSDAGVSDLDFAEQLFYSASTWVDRVQESYGAQLADPSTYASNDVNPTVVLPKNGVGDTESLMVPLRDQLAAQGVSFSTGYCAKAFVVDESGAVCGVRFATDEAGTVVDVGATCVVVATGGFSSDQALMRDYLPDWQHAACYTAASMGEGQKLCLAIGGQLSGMDVAAELTSDLPQAASWGLFASTLIVDALGNRFGREDRVGQVADACYTDGRGYWWTIFGEQLTSSGQSRMVAQVAGKNSNRMKGPFDTVEALATGAGIPADTLQATFDRYDEQVASGQDSDFGRTVHFESLTPPYYALKQFPVRYRTRGGAVVDAQGRVLDSLGSVIQGVYCCGAAACGGSEGLATNGAFGVLAGQAVVADLDAASAAAAEEEAVRDARNARF